MNALFSSVSLLLCLGVAGCYTATDPSSPSAGLARPIHPPQQPDLGHYASRTETEQLYNLWEGPGIRDVCGGPDPFFAFDSSKPDTTAQPTMQNLVDCMRSGALTGKGITLIGHTDPRGSADYNLKLGRERAERVKRYMVANGIDTQRILTDSVGKSEAKEAPKDWPADRRVEIELMTPAPASTAQNTEK
jgi:outer membrane protein OmpA-like peptidoglycan-associated protein